MQTWVEHAGDELRLGAPRAKRAAQAVMQNHERYNSLVAKAIGKADGLTLEFRKEGPAVRFDPGLIVDLPAFSIWKDDVGVATGRLCLTICMHESRSKIWTRTSSTNDAYWGGDSCEQLNKLVARSRVWFETYAENVTSLYAQDIADALMEHRGDNESNVQLTVRNRIELVSGDTTLPGLGQLAAAIANGEDVYSDERWRAAAEAARRLDALVRCVPGMGLANDGIEPVLHPAPSSLDSNQYYFVPHRTARGFRGVYAVQAQKDRLLFAGIAGTDPDPYVRVERLGGSREPVNSPSQHVTAELANTVAKYF